MTHEGYHANESGSLGGWQRTSLGWCSVWGAWKVPTELSGLESVVTRCRGFMLKMIMGAVGTK